MGRNTKKMNKKEVEHLIEQVGVREVVRVNNIIAKDKGNLDDIVYFTNEFNSFCEGAKPNEVAQFVSEGWDMEIGYAFSFSDCIIFSVNWLGDLLIATTKEGVHELLSQTLEFVSYDDFLKLVNKDYIDKF